ncbi:hypothetical protein [Ornithinicoccus hortensis]|uniref:UDP-N-acetylmuramyl pentapeptide phosphotransferase/UDP-N-acetylglucosamine-1-phosphate transferase n=1 Tax=Ornithinicoccus hortensis TaxID=82346 RepID=A0A542YLH3_9MICO|nr:hypothetical protein [Ornithinicoccus hortensis]TQL48940.1 UDP-N-acetylmuramyl pentapeptide phosphotransferase/UDP-N-acetylglucosamine-1-phosphate transferase [Ornithinicoccus hortensis]TQL52514.1 UDP-N-acetylmuramyl pentapeptide phosphotransferase/UDP-N-acetylglucosamine-1-phosphate transferase [Ornithinicoccus hortensis]
MTRWVLLALSTALATSALAPAVLSVLHRHGAMDVPNHRSSHTVPTIRGGGIACLIAIVVCAAGAHWLGMGVPWWALTAAVAMALLGLVTDLWDLPPLPRLLLQVLTGAALGAVLDGPGSLLLGAIAFPVLINAVNFMDGINGITGLTVTAWATITVCFGPSHGTAVLLVLAGSAAAGFLPWNVPHARMFLGDCGSYLFGALIAASVVNDRVTGGSGWLLLAPLLPYLADTGVTLLRRALRGEDVTQPHREHLYQRLVHNRGWSHTRVALLYAGLALACGAGAHLLASV